MSSGSTVAAFMKEHTWLLGNLKAKLESQTIDIISKWIDSQTIEIISKSVDSQINQAITANKINDPPNLQWKGNDSHAYLVLNPDHKSAAPSHWATVSILIA